METPRMKTPLLLAASALALAMTSASASAQTPPASPLTEARDWSAVLKQDAQALHDVILDSHPGTVDPLNPAFRGRVEAGLVEANRRAALTTDASGWWWAMRAYVAAFDDGHVQISMQVPGGFPIRWPGFLTVFKDADQVVADRDASDASTPPLGARLIDCDDVLAAQLAQARIGEFRGRWFLQSQHDQFGDWMFLNASNPWQTEMRQCRFDIGGQTRTYGLNWRLADAADLNARRLKLAQRAHNGFNITRQDDGGYWLSMPSFNASPDSEAYAGLTALLAEAANREADLHAAPYVVLDLRGNGGGSSHWSQMLALTLWGEPWIRANLEQTVEAVEWRPSKDNIASLEAFREEIRQGGGSADMIQWADKAITGMTQARAAGLAYWRDGDPVEEVEQTGAAPSNPNKGRIYVLTDSACASACLDAVDLWKAVGAVQVGRETSADTVYMEVRNAALPSGLAEIGVPMKVYRGRVRGNNEPQLPSHLFHGDMSDTAALAAWIRELNSRS